MTSFAVNTNRRSGFTLAEILLAMLVFAIAITTILALLARSIETVDDIVLKDEAMRLSSAVERELTQIPFRDLYESFAPHSTSERYMHAFHYRVIPSNRQPQTDRASQEFQVVPFAHPFDQGGNDWRPSVDKPDPSEPFQARDGRYFRVRLSVSPTNPKDKDDEKETPSNADNYESAALVLFAEFIPLGSPAVTTVPNTARVVYSYNFAVRR